MAIWHDPPPSRTSSTLVEVDEERRNVRDLHHGGFRNPRFAGQVIPFPQQPQGTDVPWEELPEHEWTQHGLGDPEHWEGENIFRQLDAALADYGITPPSMGSMENTGNELGSHHAQVWKNPQNNENWLVKPAPKSAKFLVDGDVAASAIQQYSGLHTPPTFKTKVGTKPASMQLMYPGAKDAYPDKAFDPEKVNPDDLLTIQKHHALDWMIGNHDAHGGQFIRDGQNNLIGIDKGQAFKHFNQDRLHWNYHPNTSYGEQEPIYNALYRNFAQGGKPLFDPRDGQLAQFIQHLQDIPDHEYAATLGPYAKGAEDAGQLGQIFGNYDGHGPQRFEPNNHMQFIQAALQRKNNLMKDMGDLYDRAMAHRMTGTKIAKVAVAPKPEELHDEHETLGSNERAKVYSDPQGRWLLKEPQKGNEYMVPLDLATSSLQKRVGLETPETWAVPLNGNLATASKMYHGAEHPWEGPPNISDLSPQDLEIIQKHQALDWLIGNHDAHVGNWLRTRDGQLVGIDKGQALKYFGHDKLDPHFHPNYYAREPIYNNLWRQHAAGMGEMADPRQGSLGEFTKKLQDIPDHEFKSMFAPYAHAAAHVGQLGTGGDDEHRPDRGLTTPRIPANNPDAFLDAMVDRKNNLSNDLGSLYDRTTKNRSTQQRFQPQSPTPSLDPDYHVIESGATRYAVGPQLPKLPSLPTPATPPAPTAPAATAKPPAAVTPPAATTTTAPGATTPSSSPPSGTAPSGSGHKVVSPLTLPGFNGIPFQHLDQPQSTQVPTSMPGSTPSTSSGSGGPGAPVSYSPSAGVDQWTPQIQEALRRNGLPVTDDYINRVKKQMQSESSGNPRAINNWDSNAQKGTPSQGLMQTIPSTFQQYHLPGDSSDITDPQANLDSAIGYAKSRYGPTLMDNSGNGIGSEHGY